MGNYNFEDDIVVGEDGEKIVITNIEELTGAKFVSDNKDNKYDVVMTKNGKNVTYEIKTDLICNRGYDTGNIFIEYECRGGDSGISVTQAKWFVTYFIHMREIWYIKTDKLKQMIEENDFKQTSFSGDSGSNTKGYLIPRYKFKKDFIVSKVGKKKKN